MPQVIKPALTKQQQAILHELYRFRYLNSGLLVKLLNAKNAIRMNERLKILTEKEYIGRRYEPGYKLIHKSASYYLLPGGRASLKALDAARYSEKALRTARRDATKTDKFIEQCLAICRLAMLLTAPEIKVFTKSQLVRYDYFPEQLPDLYIQFKTKNGVQQYLLEYLESNQPLHAILKRIKRYIKYSDEGEWEVTNTPLPPILLVCDTLQLEKKLLKYAYSAIEDADEEVLRFFITNMSKLKNASSPAWTSLEEPEELLSIENVI